MYDVSTSVSITKSRETLWTILKDIDKWPVWDTDVERVEYSGTQFLGTQGKLYMKNGKVFDFTIDTVREQEYFSYTVKLPGASTKWYWELGDNSLKMGVQISGLMRWMYHSLLRSSLEKAFDECTRNLEKM